MTRVPFVSALGGAVGAIAGYGLERTIVGGVRARDAAVDVPPLVLPDDVVEHRVTTTDGGSLRVLERGDADAQPIVLLHGITLVSEVWTYQLADLPPRFRVLALDLRGHGSSSAGTAGYALAAMAGDLATVLRHFDLREAIVVGHSMGGMVLMRAIADHAVELRERVAGCVLLSTSPGLSLPGPAHTVLDGVERLQPRLPAVPIPSNDLAYVLTRLAFGGAPSRVHVDATLHWLAATPAETSMGCGFAMGRHDARRVLRHADVRAVVVVGSKDKLTPPRLARRLASLLPGTRLEVIDGAGHQAMLERPDELAKVLVSFADEVA